MYFCGSLIIRWQSNGSFVRFRSALMIGGPMVMFGTKWPSITSRCRRSASDDGLELLGEAREVGGEQGWCDLDHES